MALKPADIAVVSRLLDEALELPASEREAWLAALPAEHQVHLGTLRDMLAQEAQLDTDPKLAALPKVPVDESVAQVGDRVGPYRLLREIGRGGMGSVWLAERADGAYTRQVALKLPRLAWGAGLAERMAREREIGMLLEHPNIARLYDAGVDERGRPFLALEYIDGQPIDAWCEAQALGVRDRLKLFVQVAKAVAYAHGRLVVHRDLKPSNVLVTPDGQAHLLDFGIAKLLQEEAPNEPALTQAQGRVLTPHYASPEQVAGAAITVQSDVYSLGVLLYELLTGTLPIAPKRGTLGAVEEAILEGDAPVASGRVKDKATARALRGEVDAILAKAMQRDPGRRYATADALALDIERHLNGETVTARPNSALYRAHRAFLRNKAAFAASSLVLAAVLVGTVSTILQAHRATREAERARMATDFVAEIFRSNTPAETLTQDDATSMRVTFLDQGAQLIETRFKGQPDIQAALYGVVGRVYADMGAGTLAVNYASRQLRTLEAMAAGPAEQVRGQMLLAETLISQEDGAAAEKQARHAVERAGSDGVLAAEANALLATVLLFNGRIDEAGALSRTTEQALLASGLADGLPMANVLHVQAELLVLANKFEDSVTIRQRQLSLISKIDGPRSIRIATIHRRSAYLFLQRGRIADAKAEMEAALVALSYGNGHQDILAALWSADFAEHLYSESRASFKETIAVVERSRRTLKARSKSVPTIVRAKLDLLAASSYMLWGDLASAETLMLSSMDGFQNESVSSYWKIMSIRRAASFFDMRGLHEKAQSLHSEALRLTQLDGSSSHPYSAYVWGFYAINLALLGRRLEAESLLDNAPRFEGEAGTAMYGNYFSRVIPEARARLRLIDGDAEGAARAMPKLALSASAAERAITVEEYLLKGEILCLTGKAAEGLELLMESTETLAKRTGEMEPELARARAAQGMCALSLGRRTLASRQAVLARKAFTLQPQVSRYYKIPLIKLEHAMGLKLPALN